MKPLFFIRYLLIAVLAIVIFNSCDNSDEPEAKANEYFLSSEVLDTITKAEAVEYFNQSPENAGLIGALIKHDVSVQKVIYRTKLKDQVIQASGLVCLPNTPGDYPVLSFQDGTKTLHSDAPTLAFEEDAFRIIECIASMGFIVTIPDNIGFGSSSNLPHPYLDAKSSTESILNLLRAQKELENEKDIVAKSTKDLFIFGYSLGGWATMQLQKTIEKNYSSEFNLIASSCGAGPYSLEYMNSYIIGLESYPMPYFIAYLLNSYEILDWVDNPLSDFFQQPYAETIPTFFDGQHSGGTINSELTTQITSLLTSDYRTNYAVGAKYSQLRSALIANSIVAWNTSTPTKLFHGEIDDYIPVGISQKMLSDFRAQGVSESKMQFILLEGADHSTGVLPTGLQTILWFISLKK
jgi:pimeloyl-ACP methyl ester carboxylesterase